MDIKLKIPLKELIICACMGNYSHRHLQELYRLFYTIAHRLIRRRMFSSRFSFNLLGLSEADITHDSIAELFVLGSSNELNEICKYFNYQHISIEDQPEEILFLHIRKLVFTAVNDNIFRLYNESDPSLGKILRNIKIALGKQSAFSLTMHFGEYYLELKTCDPLLGCRTITDEDLKCELYRIMAIENEIPSILPKLGEMLTYQEIYRRHVKMISLAYAIREGYQQHHTIRSQPAQVIDASFTEDDTEQIIKQTCRDVRNEMMPRYLQKEKVDEDTFGSYMDTVERVLCCEFIEGKDDDISYFEQLRNFKPEITKVDYMNKHRVIIEYLGKISKKRVRVRLKEIL